MLYSLALGLRIFVQEYPINLMQLRVVLGELARMISEHAVVKDSKTYSLGGERLCGALTSLEVRN